MRKIGAAASLALLGLIAVGVAEASLLALLVLFSFILKLRLGVELGPAGLLFGQDACCPSQVAVFDGGGVASLLFTTGCGVAAATWRFRRWKPAP